MGPATASAVLAPLRPELYPFFDEWIGKQIEGLGKVAFTPIGGVCLLAGWLALAIRR